jgi:MYXO-CTERM domain-containing protein
MTDRGDTYQFADDFDGDGFEDEFDNCPFTFNFEQTDLDSDTIGDACDSCVSDVNPGQENLDGDAFGDICDDDRDGDTILDVMDNCPSVPNLAQTNTDQADDGGDACDDNDDNDDLPDLLDDCRLCAPTATNCQCEDDPDGDGIDTMFDNCPTIANAELDPFGGQLDGDGDGLGDLCDPDLDGDGVFNFEDNCPAAFNPCVGLTSGQCMQPDRDRDGLGDGGGWGTDIPESCDQKECYVVDDPATCLDPSAAFTIKAVVLNTGVLEAGGDNPVIIGLFTNRPTQHHTWTAQFVDLPKTSRVTLENAESSATALTGFPELANCLEQNEDGTCRQDNKVRFMPDVDGEYTIKITVDLPNGDALNLGSSTAVATVVADVGGEAPMAGGCAGASATAMAALALGALVAVRRRKK